MTKEIYFLLNDQTDQLKQSFQGKALRVIMNRIFSEIWTDYQRWDGYKLARRYRIHPRVQGNGCLKGWLLQEASKEHLKRKGHR